MNVEILGDGEPEVAVVGLVHGDESCGLRAIRRFKHELVNSDLHLEKPVKLVLANEKAFSHGKRYLEKDLNRSFPGDPDSKFYEERLAYRLQQELQGLRVLDLHSSESPKTPFAIISGVEEEKFELARQTCMENLVEISFVEGGLIDEINGVVVECGFHNSKESAQIAYQTMINFLAAEGVLDLGYDLSNPEVFEVYEREEGANFRFVAENFQKVREGEVFAAKNEAYKVASEDFHPVLMSTNGYDEMIGFKARKREFVPDFSF